MRYWYKYAISHEQNQPGLDNVALLLYNSSVSYYWVLHILDYILDTILPVTLFLLHYRKFFQRKPQPNSFVSKGFLYKSIDDSVINL